MKQLNVSKKVTAPLLVWVSIVLIAATLLFSIMPVMSFDTGRSGDTINEFVKNLGTNADIEIPEKIDISVVKLINSIRVMGKVVKVASQTAKSVTADSTADDTLDDVKAELEALLESKAGQDTILVAAAVACTFTNSFDFGGEGSGESNILAILINILLVFCSLMFVLVSMFVIPIKLIIMLIKNLVLALQNLNTPENIASTISGKLPEMLTFPFVMMLLQTFIPGMTYAWGIVAMCYTIGFSVLFCTVITRLRTYEGKKFMYLNILQGTTLVSIIGFFVFFFNMIKTNVINNFLNGNFTKQLEQLIDGKELANKLKQPFEPNKAYVLDFVLILVFAVAFLASVAYITGAANKLSCTIDPKHQHSKLADCKLVGAILMLVTYIAPTMVAGNKNYYYIVTSKEAVGDESFLVFEAAELSALKTALVGIIIMIVAEVALIVLKKVLCKDLTALEASAIVCGVDEAPVAAPAAEEVVEAPAAEEAPATEEVSAE